ncbi:MAG: hypothetical protein J5601_00600, partial [Elusimicrobiaceae bacterium]|nr:hypothetical protein [Elusimicrobiaceae bacterium]
MAVPMYKKSAERSKVTDALSVMSSVAKSEHDFFLAKNSYTKNFDNLDIVFTDKNGEKAEGAKFETDLYKYELLDTGIFATRKTGEYSLYQDYETSQLMCTPSEHYICDGLGANFPKAVCERVGMAWANGNSTCYATDEARCKDIYGNSMWNTTYGICGYYGTKGKEINDGMECLGQNFSSCHYSIINAGGKCVGGYEDCRNSIINGGVCEGSGFSSCAGSTVNAGGECIAANGSNSACQYALINEGGKCTALPGSNNPCRDTKINGGVCSGWCYNAEIYNNGRCEGGCERVKVFNGGVCAGTCYIATVTDGGICSGTCTGAIVSDGGICSGECKWAHINDGGICVSSETNICDLSKSNHAGYTGTGCCCGNYCGTAPKCAQARCDALG